MKSKHVIHVGWRKRCAAFALALGASVLKLRNHISTKRAEPSATRRVLILEPCGMGDVIALEPLIRTLVNKGVKVGLCAQAIWRELYPADSIEGWIDANIPWTSYDSHRKYRMSDLFSAA